jgi:AcrR family transcriptional regulator
MSPGNFFEGEPEDTEEALMAATYRALCEHGYADLTIQKIGAEFEKSPSLLYHHYDGKDDLLVEFLEYMLDEFESVVPFAAGDDPWDKLLAMLDMILAPSFDAEGQDFNSAMIELRAQAATDPAYREAITRHDQFVHDKVVTVLREGIEQGRFREVDTHRVAAVVQTAFNGAMLQRVTTEPLDGSGSIEDVRNELESILEARLLPDSE